MQRLFALSLVAALALTGQAKADQVIDGGFETPVVSGGFATFTSGSMIDSGFMVTRGSVDVVASSFFPAFAGNQSLDLDGTPPGPTNGAIAQTIATTVGTAYTLTFEYSNNPFAAAGASNPASATVSLNGIVDGTVTHGNSSVANMNYQLFTFTFTATTASTVLGFSSLDSATSNGGIVLDAVSVNPAVVPEPSSLALVGIGAVMALARFRRRSA